MVANLRGLREAGRIFMLPTYSFVISVFILMGLGFYKYATGQVVATVPILPIAQPFKSVLDFTRIFGWMYRFNGS